MEEKNNGCIFCKIVKKEISTKFLAESENWIAFEDTNPQAPFHALVIPKKHIVSLNELHDISLAGELLLATAQIAQENHLEKGYRVINNVAEYGGQTVFHIHFHVMGKRPLGWPPG